MSSEISLSRWESASEQPSISKLRPYQREVALAGNSLVRDRILPYSKAPLLTQISCLVSGGGSEAIKDRYAPGAMMQVCGERLNYNPDLPNEGIFLIDEGGSEEKINSGARIAPKELLFIMPTDAAGEYRLEVRRHHPSPDGKLLIGRYAKTLTSV